MFPTRQFLVLACFFTVSRACAEDGNCSKVWYFWFAIFFAFLGIFIAAIFIANKICYKRDSVKDFRIPVHSGVSRQKSGGQASVQSRSTTVTILSPRLVTPNGQGTPPNKAVAGIGSPSKLTFGPRLKADNASMSSRPRLNQVSPFVVAELRPSELTTEGQVKLSGPGGQSKEIPGEKAPQKLGKDLVEPVLPESRVDDEHHLKAQATAATATMAAETPTSTV